MMALILLFMDYFRVCSISQQQTKKVAHCLRSWSKDVPIINSPTPSKQQITPNFESHTVPLIARHV